MATTKARPATLEDVLAETKKILDALTALDGKLEAATVGSPRTRPPGTPVGTYQPGPVSQADIDRTMGLLGDLGPDFPGSGFVAQFLAQGHTPEEVAAAIEGALEEQKEKALVLNPKDWRRAAAYLVAVSKGGGWRKETLNELRGADEGPIVNHDPASNLLQGISTANGPADLSPLVPEILARAEKSIRWDGSRGYGTAEELAAVEAALAKPRSEWQGWKDQSLLRMLLQTALLPLEPGLWQAYPDVTLEKTESVADWLYRQWRAQKPPSVEDEVAS